MKRLSAFLTLAALFLLWLPLIACRLLPTVVVTATPTMPPAMETETPAPPTPTAVVVVVTATPTIPPATETPTPVPPTETPTPVPTETPAPPTPTATSTPLPPSPTPTPHVLIPTPIIIPMPVTIFDFVVKANNAHWQSGAGTLPWPGADTDNRGFARWVNNAILEDGSTAPRVLETHPQWVANGFIQGTFMEPYYSGYVVQSGDRFVARVGLLQGASAGSANFRVMIRPEGGPNAWIGSVFDTYDGSLKTMDISLSPWAGKRVDFILRVDAGPSSAQDWAVWVEARIVR